MIIFSIFCPLTDQREYSQTKADAFTPEVFSKIINNHLNYAESQGAEYRFFTNIHPDAPGDTKYARINFSKYFYYNDLLKEDPQVLYMDFDIIPIKHDPFPFKDISIYPMRKCSRLDVLETFVKVNPGTDDYITKNHPWSSHIKLALLDILNGVDQNDPLTLYNTGIFTMTRDCFDKLDMLNIDQEIKDIENPQNDWWEDWDSIISENVSLNNEVILSHKIYKNNVPVNEVSSEYNFLYNWRDSFNTNQCPIERAKFLHFILKDFSDVDLPSTI